MSKNRINKEQKNEIINKVTKKVKSEIKTEIKNELKDELNNKSNNEDNSKLKKIVDNHPFIFVATWFFISLVIYVLGMYFIYPIIHDSNSLTKIIPYIYFAIYFILTFLKSKKNNSTKLNLIFNIFGMITIIFNIFLSQSLFQKNCELQFINSVENFNIKNILTNRTLGSFNIKSSFIYDSAFVITLFIGTINIFTFDDISKVKKHKLQAPFIFIIIIILFFTKPIFEINPLSMKQSFHLTNNKITLNKEIDTELNSLTMLDYIFPTYRTHYINFLNNYVYSDNIYIENLNNLIEENNLKLNKKYIKSVETMKFNEEFGSYGKDIIDVPDEYKDLFIIRPVNNICQDMEKTRGIDSIKNVYSGLLYKNITLLKGINEKTAIDTWNFNDLSNFIDVFPEDAFNLKFKKEKNNISFFGYSDLFKQFLEKNFGKPYDRLILIDNTFVLKFKCKSFEYIFEFCNVKYDETKNCIKFNWDSFLNIYFLDIEYAEARFGHFNSDTNTFILEFIPMGNGTYYRFIEYRSID